MVAEASCTGWLVQDKIILSTGMFGLQTCELRERSKLHSAARKCDLLQGFQRLC
jgi:hypothetical protein